MKRRIRPIKNDLLLQYRTNRRKKDLVAYYFSLPSFERLNAEE